MGNYKATKEFAKKLQKETEENGLYKSVTSMPKHVRIVIQLLLAGLSTGILYLFGDIA